MKKVMILLVSVLMISFMSCSKTDDVKQPNTDNVKQTWVFTVTTVQSVSPAMEGFPMTTVTTIEQSNLTAAEADQVIKDMATTTTTAVNGVTMTITITVTKAVKK